MRRLNVAWYATLLLFALTNRSSAQNRLSSFSRLSAPEKVWVLAHPFISLKALHITQDVLLTCKTVVKDPRLDGIEDGGQADAFRHCFWMAMLSRRIGEKRALKLGQAHEKGNYRSFLKGRTEEGALPDSVSCAMDLFNNRYGIELRNAYWQDNKEQMKERVISEILKGCLVILSRDKAGNYLDAGRAEIDMNLWKGKWNIPKILIPSSGLK